MSMQKARDQRFRTAPKPLTWELPVAALGATLFFLAVTPLVAQGAVLWARTGTFAWPHDHVWEALRGFAHGQTGAGLTDAAHAEVPGRPVLALALVATVVVAWALTVVLLWVREATGHSDGNGLADPVQAVEALGQKRLHRNAAQIRPDLYARHHH